MTATIIPPSPGVVRSMLSPTSMLFPYYWAHYLTAPSRYLKEVYEAYWEGWSPLFNKENGRGKA